MKKFISIILFAGCLSMSFTFRNGCAEILVTIIMINLQNGSSSLGDSGFSESFGIGVGNNGVIYKTSGEDTVNFQPRNSGTTQNLNCVRVQPTTFEPKIIAVGNNGAVTRSTDIGETWTVAPAVTASNLYGTDLNNAYSYAVGDNGTIIYSFDGSTWLVSQSGTTRNLKAVSINNQFGSNVVAVGEKGTILRSTNSGFNWINVSIADTTVNFYAITQKPKNNTQGNYFYIAGSNGKIYKSTDQGATWTAKNSGATSSLRSVYFVSIDSGAVTGDNGTVRMTTNGGDNWFTDAAFNNITGSVRSVSEMFRSSRTFTAVSDNGVLLISENPPYIGLNNLSSQVPSEFSLSQNYPNPFNPSTKISFSLPKSSIVKLVVYDITGKEIQALVNENLRAGVYEYEWNGIELPSGVYFYRLLTDNYAETKKMILVK